MDFMRLELSNAAPPKLAAWMKTLDTPGRKELHEEIAEGLWQLVRNHLNNAAPSRHNTANKLNATPTGFLRIAFNNTEREADAGSAAVVINSDPANNFDARALMRTRGPLRITPKEKKWLTIPIHALSYGRRVADLPSSLKIFRFPKKGGHGEKSNVIGAKMDGKLVGLYALSRGVTVPQDEGLLPSKSEMLNDAKNSVVGALDNARKKARRT